MVLNFLMACILVFTDIELLVRYSNCASNCGMINVPCTCFNCIVDLILIKLLVLLSFSFAFSFVQVVGGIDDQMPSLPSSTGVKVISYSKLLSQVIWFYLTW